MLKVLNVQSQKKSYGKKNLKKKKVKLHSIPLLLAYCRFLRNITHNYELYENIEKYFK